MRARQILTVLIASQLSPDLGQRQALGFQELNSEELTMVLEVELIIPTSHYPHFADEETVTRPQATPASNREPSLQPHHLPKSRGPHTPNLATSVCQQKPEVGMTSS